MNLHELAKCFRLGLGLAAAVALMAAAPALAADVETIIGEDVDGEARFEAVHNAGELGTEAVAPLAAELNAENTLIRRAAREALEVIVHHAGRPGAEDERRAVADALAEVLAEDHDTAVQREVLYVIGYCADQRHVDAIAAFLNDPELADAACFALVLNPSRASVRALVNAFAEADEDTAPIIVHALAQKANAALDIE